MKQSNEFIVLHVPWGGRSLIFIAGVLAFTIALAYHAALPVRAAGPWYVTPGGNDGNSCLSPASPCATINGAIGKASSGDTIYVATGTYTSSSGDEVVLIDKSITLSGGWDVSFTMQSGYSTVDGEQARRGIGTSPWIDVTIQRFVVVNGHTSEEGGGIHFMGSKFTLIDSLVQNNIATGDAGGIHNYSGGTLSILNSTISGNTGYFCSGVCSYSGAVTIQNSDVISNTGVGVYNAEILTVTLVTVSNNSEAGIIVEEGTIISSTIRSNQGIGVSHFGEMLTIENSEISENGRTSESGGGISNSGILIVNSSTISGNTGAAGGGIYNWGTRLLINSSTISGNTGADGGGIYNENWGNLVLNNSTVSGNHAYNRGGGIYNLGTTTLSSSTVNGNSATLPDTNNCTLDLCSGGGVYNLYGTVTIQNTIIAGNSAFRVPDCSGIINSLGYNLIGNTLDCSFAHTTGDLENVNPLLSTNPIGSPGYHPLLRMSPAINAGNPLGCNDHLGDPLETDQRGVARVGRCDIGSYEYDPANDPIKYIALPLVLRSPCPDFFDNFSNPASGWLVGEDDSLRAEYLSGEYRVLVKQAGSTFVFRAPTCNRQNYILEVDGRWGGNPGASYGLIFGIVGDFEQFYTLEVSPDVRRLALYRYVSGTWSEIWSHTDLAFIWDENQLKLTRNGDAINLVVNGTTIVETFYDNTITGMTGVGLIVSSLSDLPNADVRFDNFSVSKLNGSVTAGNRQNGNAGSAEPQASFRMLENAESAEQGRQSPER